MRILIWALTLPALAACAAGDEQQPADNAGTDATAERLPEESAASPGDHADALAGRWTGVEGTYLVVTPRAEPGRYTLEMQYDLDNSGTYEGRSDGNGIVFERNGETLRLAPSDGQATGLRWLFGKADCLTIAEGEGYCRD